MVDTERYAERLLLAAMESRGLDRLALRALHKAMHLLALALGERLRQMRQAEDPFVRTAGEQQEQGLLIRPRVSDALQDLCDVLVDQRDGLSASAPGVESHAAAMMARTAGGQGTQREAAVAIQPSVHSRTAGESG